MRGAMVMVTVVAFAGAARAAPVVVRMASVAPEGTAWAHELRAIATDVEAATGGAVKVKWYFGGIAGDDVQTGERIERGQLDGVASAGLLCSKLAPSMRVLRLLGLFQNRNEAAYVMGRLKPSLDQEFRSHGFTNLVEVGLGSDVLFSRAPLRTFDDLRRTRMWIWSLDDVMRLQLPLIGAQTVPLPLDQAARAFDDRRIDAFMALPTAALAFQWSAQVRYVSDLYMGFLSGCLIVSNRAFEALPIEGQSAFRAAAAKLQQRVEDMGRYQDDAILKGMFARQGLQAIHVDASFRAEFFDAARAARDRLGEQLVPKETLLLVFTLLADFRGERQARPARK
jgi:TRAP-type C4-dicarboxylate transport system substrate-binding protein